MKTKAPNVVLILVQSLLNYFSSFNRRSHFHATSVTLLLVEKINLKDTNSVFIQMNDPIHAISVIIVVKDKTS